MILVKNLSIGSKVEQACWNFGMTNLKLQKLIDFMMIGERIFEIH